MEGKRYRQEYRRRWMKISRTKLSASKIAHNDSEDSDSDLEAAYDSQSAFLVKNNAAEYETDCVNAINSDAVLKSVEIEPSASSSIQETEEHTDDEVSVSDIWDAIDEHAIESESEEDSESEKKDCVEKVREELVLWCNSFSVKQNALDELLKLLKRNIPQLSSLPSSARTLLKTPKSVQLCQISNMQYYHFGLKNELFKVLSKTEVRLLKDTDVLELTLNIDGLPLFKSSRTSLWPVLCMINNIPRGHVFPVTMTSGRSKPSDLTFLSDTVEELKCLLEEGIDYGDQHIKVILKCIVCDAPAKAQVKATKQCTGYYGCDKCTLQGEWRGRVTFLETAVELRTDYSFRTCQQKLHHNGVTPFQLLPINMIDCFPIDYMHQVCLGVMKRLLLVWIRGERKTRISRTQINVISERLVGLQRHVPNNFGRRPRSLDEIDRWKAVEYRQLLLYTGQTVLKGILPEEFYEHFMCLSVAISILVNNKLAKQHNAYAHKLLTYFVEACKVLYSDEFIVYNVHTLIHLSHEALVHGSLENCAAWKFESYMQVLKKMVRSGKNPVAQIVKRASEQTICSSVPTHVFNKGMKSSEGNTVSASPPNNGYMLKDGSFSEIVSIEDGGLREQDEASSSTKLLCRVYKTAEPLFTKPCDSRLLGFGKVYGSSAAMKYVTEASLDRKCFVIDHGACKEFRTLLHD